MVTTRKYGWIPDHPDQRDLRFRASPKLLKALPDTVDLRKQMPIIFDQGDLGSCTANATGAQVWHVDKTKPAMPSRLFIYYNSRKIEGTTGYDSGATIRDSIKSVVKYGFAPETAWPYNIAKFTKKPPKVVYDAAAKEKVTKYARVTQALNQIQARLAEGHTVNFGFSVYESFESETVAQTGIMPMPGASEVVLGGHAVLIVGYNNAKKWFIVRNSWGDAWGDKGYFYMPYDFALDSNQADDFWTITGVP